LCSGRDLAISQQPQVRLVYIYIYIYLFIFMTPFAGEVIGLLQASARQKNITLTYQCTADGECTADEIRWRQLVMYLLSNGTRSKIVVVARQHLTLSAIKSTSEGGSVHVILSKAGWSFTLQIKDTGTLNLQESFQKITQFRIRCP
jgi:signal transduction histidine kinase